MQNGTDFNFVHCDTKPRVWWGVLCSLNISPYVSVIGNTVFMKVSKTVVESCSNYSAELDLAVASSEEIFC